MSFHNRFLRICQSKLAFLCVLFSLISCDGRKEYLIQVPEVTHITSESILTDLANRAIDNPESDRLIKQQLYFCEQLGWPIRCEQVLEVAKEKWGLTESLLDQSIAYYLKHDEYQYVEDLLKGAFETRSRMEARIQIAFKNNRPDLALIDRYKEQYPDLQSYVILANGFLLNADTIQATEAFTSVLHLDATHDVLLKYVPILESQGRLEECILITENQLVNRSNLDLSFNLARYYYISDQDSIGLAMMRKIDTEKAHQQLASWFIEQTLWDSGLTYLDKLLVAQPENPAYLLRKAETLEAKGWVTPSLPYYERALAIDSLNAELADHVNIVRRKVAYLRRLREQENQPLPPVLERKTAE